MEDADGMFKIFFLSGSRFSRFSKLPLWMLLRPQGRRESAVHATLILRMRFIDCERGVLSCDKQRNFPRSLSYCPKHATKRLGLHGSQYTPPRGRLHRVDEPLWIKHIVDSSGRGVRLVYVAHGAFACVARASLRAHCRVADVGIILITGMNAVNQ